jgi:hypothetical protein
MTLPLHHQDDDLTLSQAIFFESLTAFGLKAMSLA